MGAKKVCTRMISLLLLCLLCGCTGADSNNDLTLELRSDFLSREGCSGVMELTADYGQRVYAYTVEFDGTVKAVSATVGSTVNTDDLLVTLG